MAATVTVGCVTPTPSAAGTRPTGRKSFPAVDEPSPARHAAFTCLPYSRSWEPAERSDRERRNRAHDRVPAHHLGERHRVRISRPDVPSPCQLPRDVRAPVAGGRRGPTASASTPTSCSPVSPRSTDPRRHRRHATTPRRPPAARPGGVVCVRAWSWWSGSSSWRVRPGSAFHVAWFTTPSAGVMPLAVWNSMTCGLGARPEAAVGRADVVAECVQPLLQHRGVRGVGGALLERRAGAKVVVVVTGGAVVTVVVTVAESPPDDALTPGREAVARFDREQHRARDDREDDDDQTPRVLEPVLHASTLRTRSCAMRGFRRAVPARATGSSGYSSAGVT